MKHANLVKKIIGAASAAALLLAVTKAPGQTPAQPLAAWYVDGITTNTSPAGNGGGPNPAPFTNSIGAANTIVGVMMKGAAPGPGFESTLSTAYGGNTWTNAGFPDDEASSISNGLYITYSVAADPGYTISFYSNIFYYHNSATGPTNGMLQYSTDGTNYTDILPVHYAPNGTAETGLMTNILLTNAFLQNVPSTITNYFRLVNWGATGTAGTWYLDAPTPSADTPLIGTNGFVIFGGLYAPGGIVEPADVVVSPTSISTNAGASVGFTASATGSAASYFWYQVVGGVTNLLATQTNASLSLNGIVEANAGSYFVVLSNSAGMATSSEVSLAVNDPYILVEPNGTEGLLDGMVEFAVTAAGTSLQYQWYYSDANGDLLALVPNGRYTGGSFVSGATGPVLTITNLQSSDFPVLPTNFLVVVTGYGGNTVDSAPAQLLSIGTSAILAFWNFNGPPFLNNIANPVPYFGTGTAGPVGSCNDPGTSPFSGSVDPEDNPGGPFPDGESSASFPNYSWGTDNYPASGSNKLNGVQVNVSTVGAKNITVSYDSRVSATASDYERLQYTTDGVNWTDYPTSSSFNGEGTTYIGYTYNLTSFSNVANNPNFGVRVVTEYQSTATYGVSPNANYVGTANSYGTTGTVTYDVVNISGDAITNTYAPPSIIGLTNITTPDYIPVSENFTISSPTTPVNQLVVTAVSLVPANVNPTLTVTADGGGAMTLNISPNIIPGNVGASPIMVTVTDTNGDSTSEWFYLTETSVNLPPTNSLALITATNMLPNTSLVIPFTVTDDRTPTNGASFTYAVSSDNNTLLPNGNLVIDTLSPSNGTLTISPAIGQAGLGQVSFTTYDNDPVDPKSATATFTVEVRPNTNIVLIDYFDYDSSGSLDTISSNTWGHLSGVLGQLQVAGNGQGDYAIVDTANSTENLQAKLQGAPFATNSGDVLYSSFIVNMNPQSIANGMPSEDGSYFLAFNDGSGVTGRYECRVIAATNGAAPGFYRLGIDNYGTTAIDGEAQMFPMDLAPQSNYVVVTSLVLSNGESTLWVSPTLGQSSPSVTDASSAASQTGTNYNISDLELRESGTYAGTVGVGHLKIGTTFDSVFPSLQIQLVGTNVIVNWSDPTLGLLSATNVLGPWTPVALTPGINPPYTNSADAGPVYYIFAP